MHDCPNQGVKLVGLSAQIHSGRLRIVELARPPRSGRKAFLLLWASALFFLSFCQAARADNVTLAWDPPDSAVGLAGYKLYYGLYSGDYSTVVDVGNFTTYTVTGLGPGVYYFAVTAYDTDGVQSGFSNEVSQSILGTLTTPQLTVDYPSIFSMPLGLPAVQNQGVYTAIALTNRDSSAATLRFTAYDTNGTPASGSGLTNPAMRELNPGDQLPVLDDQLFGSGIDGSGSPGWIRIESSTDKLAGFFEVFDSTLLMLDGATFSATPLDSYVVPEVAAQDFTDILVANPNMNPAAVSIQLVGADGSILSTNNQNLSSNSTLAADLFADLFPGTAVDPADYVRISSTQGLLAYETFGRISKDVAVLAGQDSNGGASQLYSPQYAVGGPWRSTISIVNLSGIPGTLTLKLFSDSGSQIGSAVVQNIAGGGKLYVSDQQFFTGAIMTNSGQVVQGYVDISGPGLQLAGSVVFGDAVQGVFTTALPLVSSLQQSAIFSHVASDNTYFTGLAVVNPNNADSTVTISLYNANGVLDSSIVQTIPAHQRFSGLLTQIFPALVGQSRTSGYFTVTSNIGMACFALFGTNDLSVLSAIPAN